MSITVTSALLSEWSWLFITSVVRDHTACDPFDFIHYCSDAWLSPTPPN